MSIVSKITNYFKDAFTEVRKVVWPTKKQTILFSAIVIALTVFVAIFFGVLDFTFKQLLALIIN